MGKAENCWNLVADIGGTNARFGLQECASGKLGVVRHYSVEQYAVFEDALQDFLDELGASGAWASRPGACCLAVAGPVDVEEMRFTNSPWRIDPAGVAAGLQLPRLDVINDFVAVGLAVTDLEPRDWHQIGGGKSVPGRPLVVLGPGTGLGVCALVPDGDNYQVIEGEGGHVDFAPVDAEEIAVHEILTRKFGRVGNERLLSGSGIQNIYQALAQLAGIEAACWTPADITAAALAGSSPEAVRALEMFCRVLGSTAGNLALTIGARGGVCIAGGIVPRMIGFLAGSEFRRRFEAKGRLRGYLQSIPVRVIVKRNLGLLGAIRKLDLGER